jgi:CRISPR-associated protein Csx17
MEPLYLYGCRHDILGHYPKAIGLLRVLTHCADKEHCDPEAEGWWDLERGCFRIRSLKYPTAERLTKFFAEYYQPTPFFSPWNTGGGLNEKKEIIFSIDQSPWTEFWAKNRDRILPQIADKKEREKAIALSELRDDPIKFTLLEVTELLTPHEDIKVVTGLSKGKNAKPTIEISWSEAAKTKFFEALAGQQMALEAVIKFTDAVKKKFVKRGTSFCFDIENQGALALLPSIPGVLREVRVKESGKKAVLAILAKTPGNPPELKNALNTGRDFFPRFQEDVWRERTLLEQFRELSPASSAEAMDAVFTTRVAERTQDNPLFLNRGDAGQAEIFRTFWFYFLEVKGYVAAAVEHGLIGSTSDNAPTKDGKGTPFFPDAIKAYNIGSGWVTETFPFNALDYILAVEGGFAMRGGVARTLTASSKRFAAFPFVFDSGEEMVDDANEVKGTANALWFPLWNRPTTFAELFSFISDAQARLPGKEVRFSAEFVRALNAQGVDAGFVGWQEFRFKMKVSRVPWITTGRYVEATFRADATRLNRALHPLDESRFLDQFEIAWKGNKVAARSPHQMRAEINDAMETATYEPTPPNCLNLLGSIFRTCRRMAISESLRDSLPGKRAYFFRPLPINDWNELFSGFDVPEFRIARALAAIQSNLRQLDGRVSKTLPMLGSILPLKIGPTGWYLPKKGDRSNQAVWSGTDLCHDLAAVLSRRYMDSLTDDRPALLSTYGAELADVLDFLRKELDDQLIACWTESLSLIDWSLSHADETQQSSANYETPAIPPEYAALRTLLELECEPQPTKEAKKRRSQQPSHCSANAPVPRSLSPWLKPSDGLAFGESRIHVVPRSSRVRSALLARTSSGSKPLTSLFP